VAPGTNRDLSRVIRALCAVALVAALVSGCAGGGGGGGAFGGSSSNSGGSSGSTGSTSGTTGSTSGDSGSSSTTGNSGSTSGNSGSTSGNSGSSSGDSGSSSGDSGSTSGNSGSDSGSSGSGSTGNTGSTGPIPQTTLGRPLTLDASQESDTITTTITGVRNLTDSGHAPARGTRFVGVTLTLRNRGRTAFQDSLANDVVLITTAGTQLQPVATALGGCHTPATVDLRAGETLRTCLAFDQPVGEAVKLVQVSLDSGLAPPGQWSAV
jgi:hypothetical protein